MNQTRYHLFTGLIQGCVLLIFHQSIVHEWNVVSWPEFAFPAYALVIIIPIVTLLCQRFTDLRTLFYFLGGLTVLFVVLGYYSGHLGLDKINNNNFSHIFVFAGSMLGLTYVGLPFMQSYLRQRTLRFSYDDLYEFGWLNTSVLLMAILFTSMVWILLGLCSALFSILHIELFTDLFYDPYFAYPATAMMFCYGLALGLQRFHIGMVQRIDFFFRAITVLTSLIVVLFLIALLVSGLEPLWDMGSATLLLLWLQIFILLFVNSMFQRGYDQREESVILRWSVTLSLIAMPIFSAISIYAMFLRIDQHGWTVDRIWASIIIVVISVYALGYAYAALRGAFKKSNWLSEIAPTNIFAALLMMSILIFTHSPLLAPSWIAADSQVSRLLSGKVTADDFDYSYLRFDLGLAGKQNLKVLSEIKIHPEAARIQVLAKQALARTRRWDDASVTFEKNETKQFFEIYPKGHDFDVNLVNFLYAESTNWRYKNCFSSEERCLILYVDLNQDQLEEVVVFTGAYQQPVLSLVHGTWQEIGTVRNGISKSESLQVIKKRLESEAISTEKQRWDHLKIGYELWSISID